jgi:hypothetical protein
MSEAQKKQAPTQDEIAVRAYEIYVERGSIDGDDVSNWLEAEAELTKLAEAETQSSQTFKAEARPESRLVDSPISAPNLTGTRSRATVA